MSQLEISAGEYTEDLWQFIQKELSDEQLDEIEVERVLNRESTVASEAITTTIILVVGPVLITAIARSVEKWIEVHRQKMNLEMLIRAHGVSLEAGAAVQELTSLHAKVTVQVLPELKPEKG